MNSRQSISTIVRLGNGSKNGSVASVEGWVPAVGCGSEMGGLRIGADCPSPR